MLGSSPKLIAAVRVFHRLPMPRHPPDALCILEFNCYPKRMFFHVVAHGKRHSLFLSFPMQLSMNNRANPEPSYAWMIAAIIKIAGTTKFSSAWTLFHFFDPGIVKLAKPLVIAIFLQLRKLRLHGPCNFRIPIRLFLRQLHGDIHKPPGLDLRILRGTDGLRARAGHEKQSHHKKNAFFHHAFFPPDLVGLDRLELSTSRLSGVRSNHLSYRPFFAWSFCRWLRQILFFAPVE